MTDKSLEALENKSIFIIREAYKRYKNIAMLWSIGKDSILGDSELYYKINGKLKRSTIEKLYKEVTPKETHKKGKKELIIPKERVEVLTVSGRNQKKAILKFGEVKVLISHLTAKDIYNVKLRGDRNIKVTGDHSLVGACSGKDGLSLKEIEARKLSTKNLIFCPNKLNFDVKDLKRWNSVAIEDWLLTLGGLWLADGCYAVDRKIIISTGKNQGILNFLKKIPREKPVTEEIAKELEEHPEFDGKNLKMDLARRLSKKYGVSFWASYDSKKRMEKLLNRSENMYLRINKNGDVWICSKKLVTKLKTLGFEGTGNNKKIPDWLYTISNKQIALFLAGFFAGDGSCYKKGNKFAISFSGMNEKLLKGIKPLLLRLGVSHGFSASNARGSGFRTKNKKIYQITVSSKQSIKNFLGFIPDLAEKLINIKISWEGKSNYQISARKVKEVKILPKKLRRVYDIEVENTHNFIANEIVCHNSTTLLYLCKKAFYGKIPFPVIHIDTSYKFPEIYKFRDRYSKEWNLNLIIAKNKEALKAGMSPNKGRFDCCTKLKTEALKQCLKKYKFDALLLAIRRDEHAIRGKERYFCFPAETLIYGENVKEIKDVVVGDKVYSWDGKLKEVEAVSKRNYKGKLTGILPYFYNFPIYSSPNHPYLTKRLVKVGRSKKQWVEASKLKKGDWIFIPKIYNHYRIYVKEIKIKDYLTINDFKEDKKILYYNRTTKTAPKIPKIIKISEELCRCFGYYIAEGCASKNCIQFTVNAKEQDIAKEFDDMIYRYFNVKGKILRQNKSIIHLKFDSKILSNLFSNLFGSGARNKHLPKFFNKLSKLQLFELVNGCWIGDGYYQSYTTTSKILAHQLRMCLLKFKMPSTLKITKRDAYVLEIPTKFKEKFKTVFNIPIAPHSHKYKGFQDIIKEINVLGHDHTQSYRGGFWIKIRNISEKNYNGQLYNLMVDKTKSFLVNGFAVHNSPRDKEFKWQFAREKLKEEQKQGDSPYVALQDTELSGWDLYGTDFGKECHHVRIHPLLHWTELDIWKFIQKENIPIVDLYFAKKTNDGKRYRYRSIGCECCCNPVLSEAKNKEEVIKELEVTKEEERAGRAQDKESEYMMQKLRALGYMSIFIITAHFLLFNLF